MSSSSKCLAPNGTFRQLTVIPYIYWKLYRGYFSDVRFKLVPMNLPPGGVYVCRGFREEEKARPRIDAVRYPGHFGFGSPRRM